LTMSHDRERTPMETPGNMTDAETLTFERDRKGCPQCGEQKIVLSLLTSRTRYFACRSCQARWEISVASEAA